MYLPTAIALLRIINMSIKMLKFDLHVNGSNANGSTSIKLFKHQSPTTLGHNETSTINKAKPKATLGHGCYWGVVDPLNAESATKSNPYTQNQYEIPKFIWFNQRDLVNIFLFPNSKFCVRINWQTVRQLQRAVIDVNQLYTEWRHNCIKNAS